MLDWFRTRPMLPSGSSCLALDRNLTLFDERYWFEAVVEACRSAISRSDEIITSRGLDDPPARPEDWWESAGPLP